MSLIVLKLGGPVKSRDRFIIGLRVYVIKKLISSLQNFMNVPDVSLKGVAAKALNSVRNRHESTQRMNPTCVSKLL